jgi:uncharacterized repeat protein (TIGR01451 family)
VASAPAAIDCGTQCSASFPYDSAVTLTASAQPGSVFNGWGGACRGTGTCTVTMSQSRSVTASFIVPPPADLALTQSTEQDPAAVGRDANLTLTVTNNGPGAASGVTVTDTLPAGVAFIGPMSGCSDSSGTVTCTVGPLAYGASTRVTLVVQPTVAGTMRNDASVSGVGADPDPDTTNNSSSLTIPVDASPASHLSNISTRGKVLTGNDVMIGGFIIGGSGEKTVAITATGPSLAAFGVSNALSNPKLTLVRSSDQSVIATNDDWQADANAPRLQASGFAPPDPREPGLYVTHPPRAYTAIV